MEMGSSIRRFTMELSNQYFIRWISAGLMLMGLPGLASMSLATEDTWATKADMPTARWGHSTSVVNGKIYAIGGALGLTPLDTGLSAVEEYDPATNKWTIKADMPTARGGLATSVVNGKIYAIGGASNGQIFSTVEEYDPDTDTWTKKSDIPTTRWNLSAGAVNGKIYAIGHGNLPVLLTVEEYDPETDTWMKKADMPTKRRLLSTSAVNGRIYAIGGANIDNRTLSTVEEYDPETDTWTRKSDMPTPRMLSSTTAVNGKIYAIGGQASFDPRVQALSTVEEYDPKTDTWTKKVDMPTPRYVSTSAVDGRIYAIGGGDLGGTLLSTVEEYTPESWLSPVSLQGKLAATWGNIKQGNLRRVLR
jgi:N-acetylneuraminic acid mutarotase